MAVNEDFLADLPQADSEQEAPAAVQDVPAAEEAVSEAPAAKAQASESDNKKPMRWYVVQAFSGFEQRVAQTLSDRRTTTCRKARMPPTLIDRKCVSASSSRWSWHFIGQVSGW